MVGDFLVVACKGVVRGCKIIAGGRFQGKHGKPREAKLIKLSVKTFVKNTVDLFS